ncbi:MAG: exo-beta-N-acetylmuramidase NamZ family protein [Bacteroidota bacterium]
MISPEIAVRTGADRLLTDGIDLIRNKRVGILTNHTGRLSDGRHIVDAVASAGVCTIVALYGPEHGIFGNNPDGSPIADTRYHTGNIPVFSLYGSSHRPTGEMLSGIDMLICDIQDIGARFYTFISTVALAIESAAECHKEVLVLDRPNPIRGIAFDGPIRDESLRSFVGWMPIPVTHGMTYGELAALWNEEGVYSNGVHARLTVLPLIGWNRSMWYDETALPWIPPSPNMPTLDTAAIYPGLCLTEGTSLSEGRGTASPFELIGAPWLDSEKVLAQLDNEYCQGIRFSTEEFVPASIPGKAIAPKYVGEQCRGIRLHVIDRNRIEPLRLGISILSAVKRLYPGFMTFDPLRFDLLSGRKSIRQSLEEGADAGDIIALWAEDVLQFGDIRSRYLQYHHT